MFETNKLVHEKRFNKNHMVIIRLQWNLLYEKGMVSYNLGKLLFIYDL